MKRNETECKCIFRVIGNGLETKVARARKVSVTRRGFGIRCA
jgi:hypothetical protein